MKKTVLITGGLGYLGGRIAQSLILGGQHNVVVGVRSDQSNLPKELFKCEAALLDLFEKDNLQSLLVGIDIVIHLAAVNAGECDKNPEIALLTNVLGTLNLVQAAEKSKVKKIIYFSTAHVYCSPLKGNISEKTVTTPNSHYAITHRAAEDYIIKAGKEGKINTTVIRLSNAIGKPVNKSVNCWMLVANDMAKQVVEKNKIHLKSSGSQLRDFIPISNVISAVKLLLKNDIASGEVFNLGLGESISILQLANILADRAKVILNLDVDISTINTTEEYSLSLIHI